MKRNSKVETSALGVALLVFAFQFASTSSAQEPGSYVIKNGIDEAVCQRARDVLNSGLYPGNRFGRAVDSAFISWTVVGNLAPDSEGDVDDGDLTEARADIDNDGEIDRLYRWKASIRGVKADQLFVPKHDVARIMEERGVSLHELYRSSRIVSINGSAWIQSVQKRHSSDWESWTAGFISTLEVMRYANTTYVLAYTPRTPRDLSTEAIVLQLMPGDDGKGICMMHRTCPCGGCTDLRGRSGEQFLPARKACPK
jgi:hypothetical protein